MQHAWRTHDFSRKIWTGETIRETLVADGRIILKWSKQCSMRVRSAFSWLRIGSSGGFV
jgi:hypothetical protein